MNISVREGLKTLESPKAIEPPIVKSGILHKMKDKWGLKSLMQVVAVLAVFTLTGSTIVYVRTFLFIGLGFDETTPFWLKTVSYILFVMPFYQVLLLIYGFLLGQFAFFWEKEKKLARRIGKLFYR